MRDGDARLNTLPSHATSIEAVGDGSPLRDAKAKGGSKALLSRLGAPQPALAPAIGSAIAFAQPQPWPQPALAPAIDSAIAFACCLRRHLRHRLRSSQPSCSPVASSLA